MIGRDWFLESWGIMIRRVVLLSVVFALAACAGDMGWVNPNLPKKQADGDYASCRRYAESAAGIYDTGDERDSNALNMAARDDSRRQFNAYLSVCMREKGYFPKK